MEIEVIELSDSEGDSDESTKPKSEPTFQNRETVQSKLTKLQQTYEIRMEMPTKGSSPGENFSRCRSDATQLNYWYMGVKGLTLFNGRLYFQGCELGCASVCLERLTDQDIMNSCQPSNTVKEPICIGDSDTDPESDTNDGTTVESVSETSTEDVERRVAVVKSTSSSSCSVVMLNKENWSSTQNKWVKTEGSQAYRSPLMKSARPARWVSSDSDSDFQSLTMSVQQKKRLHQEPLLGKQNAVVADLRKVMPESSTCYPFIGKRQPKSSTCTSSTPSTWLSKRNKLSLNRTKMKANYSKSTHHNSHPKSNKRNVSSSERILTESTFDSLIKSEQTPNIFDSPDPSEMSSAPSKGNIAQSQLPVLAAPKENKNILYMFHSKKTKAGVEQTKKPVRKSVESSSSSDIDEFDSPKPIRTKSYESPAISNDTSGSGYVYLNHLKKPNASEKDIVRTSFDGQNRKRLLIHEKKISPIVESCGDSSSDSDVPLNRVSVKILPKSTKKKLQGPLSKRVSAVKKPPLDVSIKTKAVNEKKLKSDSINSGSNLASQRRNYSRKSFMQKNPSKSTMSSLEDISPPVTLDQFHPPKHPASTDDSDITLPASDTEDTEVKTAAVGQVVKRENLCEFDSSDSDLPPCEFLSQPTKSTKVSQDKLVKPSSSKVKSLDTSSDWVDREREKKQGQLLPVNRKPFLALSKQSSSPSRVLSGCRERPVETVHHGLIMPGDGKLFPSLAKQNSSPMRTSSVYNDGVESSEDREDDEIEEEDENDEEEDGKDEADQCGLILPDDRIHFPSLAITSIRDPAPCSQSQENLSKSRTNISRTKSKKFTKMKNGEWRIGQRDTDSEEEEDALTQSKISKGGPRFDSREKSFKSKNSRDKKLCQMGESDETRETTAQDVTTSPHAYLKSLTKAVKSVDKPSTEQGRNSAQIGGQKSHRSDCNSEKNPEPISPMEIYIQNEAQRIVKQEPDVQRMPKSDQKVQKVTQKHSKSVDKAESESNDEVDRQMEFHMKEPSDIRIKTEDEGIDPGPLTKIKTESKQDALSAKIKTESKQDALSAKIKTESSTFGGYTQEDDCIMVYDSDDVDTLFVSMSQRVIVIDSDDNGDREDECRSECTPEVSDDEAMKLVAEDRSDRPPSPSEDGKDDDRIAAISMTRKRELSKLYAATARQLKTHSTKLMRIPSQELADDVMEMGDLYKNCPSDQEEDNNEDVPAYDEYEDFYNARTQIDRQHGAHSEQEQSDKDEMFSMYDIDVQSNSDDDSELLTTKATQDQSEGEQGDEILRRERTASAKSTFNLPPIQPSLNIEVERDDETFFEERLIDELIVKPKPMRTSSVSQSKQHYDSENEEPTGKLVNIEVPLTTKSNKRHLQSKLSERRFCSEIEGSKEKHSMNSPIIRQASTKKTDSEVMPHPKHKQIDGSRLDTGQVSDGEEVEQDGESQTEPPAGWRKRKVDQFESANATQKKRFRSAQDVIDDLCGVNEDDRKNKKKAVQSELAKQQTQKRTNNDVDYFCETQIHKPTSSEKKKAADVFERQSTKDKKSFRSISKDSNGKSVDHQDGPVSEEEDYNAATQIDPPGRSKKEDAETLRRKSHADKSDLSDEDNEDYYAPTRVDPPSSAKKKKKTREYSVHQKKPERKSVEDDRKSDRSVSRMQTTVHAGYEEDHSADTPLDHGNHGEKTSNISIISISSACSSDDNSGLHTVLSHCDQPSGSTHKSSKDTHHRSSNSSHHSADEDEQDDNKTASAKSSRSRSREKQDDNEAVLTKSSKAIPRKRSREREKDQTSERFSHYAADEDEYYEGDNKGALSLSKSPPAVLGGNKYKQIVVPSPYKPDKDKAKHAVSIIEAKHMKSQKEIRGEFNQSKNFYSSNSTSRKPSKEPSTKPGKESSKRSDFSSSTGEWLSKSSHKHSDRRTDTNKHSEQKNKRRSHSPPISLTQKISEAKTRMFERNFSISTSHHGSTSEIDKPEEPAMLNDTDVQPPDEEEMMRMGLPLLNPLNVKRRAKSIAVEQRFSSRAASLTESLIQGQTLPPVKAGDKPKSNRSASIPQASSGKSKDVRKPEWCIPGLSADPKLKDKVEISLQAEHRRAAEERHKKPEDNSAVTKHAERRHSQSLKGSDSGWTDNDKTSSKEVNPRTSGNEPSENRIVDPRQKDYRTVEVKSNEQTVTNQGRLEGGHAVLTGSQSSKSVSEARRGFSISTVANRDRSGPDANKKTTTAGNNVTKTAPRTALSDRTLSDAQSRNTKTTLPTKLVTKQGLPVADVSRKQSSNLHCYLEKILKWNVTWFEEQEKKAEVHNSSMPPVTGDMSSIGPLCETYDSYDDYQRIMTPLLVLETWEVALRNWQDQHKNLMSFMCGMDNLIPNIDANKKLMSIRWHTVISKQQLGRRSISEGDLVIVHLAQKTLQSKEAPPYRVFGYVDRARIFSSHHMAAQLFQQFKAFKEDLTVKGGNFSCISFDVITRYRRIIPLQHILMKVEVVGSISTSVRQYLAMLYLPNSVLARDILRPVNLSVFSDSSVKVPPNLKDVLNECQAQAVSLASHVSQQPATLPRIVLIQGPPGTGKSHTIVELVKQIHRESRGSGRILLCTPSNGAVDELMRRLITDRRRTIANKEKPLNFVRVGNPSSIHPDVRLYGIQNLVKQNLARMAQRKSSHMLGSLKTELTQIDTKINTLKNQLACLPDGISKERTARLREDLKKLTIRRQIIDKRSNQTKARPTAEEEHSQRRKTLLGADLICATLSGMGSNSMLDVFLRRADKDPRKGGPVHFSCIIVDEATQCIELDCLIPLQYGTSKLVLVGDPEQLPATVTNMKARENNFQQSLFERLYSYLNTKFEKTSPVLFLDTQYRMDPEICDFPNTMVYDNRLQTDRSVHERCQTFPLQPYLLFNMRCGQELNAGTGTISNPLEADFIVQLCEFLVHEVKLNAQQIAIIAPYQKQKGLLRELLSDKHLRVEVGTVDGFQGQEKDIVILSCVRAKSASGGIGFLGNRQRLNVALTRARYALFVVGCTESLKTNDLWKALIKNAKCRQRITTVYLKDQFDSAIRKCLKKNHTD